MRNHAVSYVKEDGRPAMVLDTDREIRLDDLKWQKLNGAPSFVMRRVEDLTAAHCAPLPDSELKALRTGYSSEH